MEELLKYFKDIEKIKHLEREGWLRMGVRGVIDTIASHVYGVGMIGWEMAKREGLNTNKVLKMCLVSELIMSKIEDFTPKDKEYYSKMDVQKEAVDKLIDDVPKDLKKDFRAYMEEFLEYKTPEAILARECHKIETLLQAIFYSARLGRDEIQQFLNEYRPFFKSKTGKQLFKEIEKEYGKKK